MESPPNNQGQTTFSIRPAFALILAFVLTAPAAAQSEKRKAPVKQKDMDSLSCEQQKRAYRESEACFARYRDPQTKKLHPKAYSSCRELKQPQC